MKNWDSKLVSLLDPILPTYSENPNQALTTPCITYRNSNNVRDLEGDDLRYARVYYIIKLHVTDIEEAQQYLEDIDLVLYLNRFFRESFDHILVGDVHEYIITYSVFTKEIITERT